MWILLYLQVLHHWPVQYCMISVVVPRCLPASVEVCQVPASAWPQALTEHVEVILACFC